MWKFGKKNEVACVDENGNIVETEEVKDEKKGILSNKFVRVGACVLLGVVALVGTALALGGSDESSDSEKTTPEDDEYNNAVSDLVNEIAGE